MPLTTVTTGPVMGMLEDFIVIGSERLLDISLLLNIVAWVATEYFVCVKKKNTFRSLVMKMCTLFLC